MTKKQGTRKGSVNVREFDYRTDPKVKSMSLEEFADKETDSQVDKLLRIAQDVELFCTPSGYPSARIHVGDHFETWLLGVKGEKFRQWLVHQYRMQYNTLPSTTALAGVMEALVAQARFDGGVNEVYLHVAEHKGVIYVDLRNNKYQAVKITANGWSVIAKPPIYFRRTQAMKPLPIPKKGGSLNDMRQFVQTDNDGWVQVIAWLIGSLHPYGPYPVLSISGQTGTSKSALTKTLRSVVDPAIAGTRSAPKDEQTLHVTAHNNWVLALDNLSSIPLWLSDAICRIATGAGSASRTLYTDTEETLIEATRPVIINGIGDIVTQGDLGSRCMHIILQKPAKRRTERELKAEFERLHPYILGALFDAVSMALRNRDRVVLNDPSRMADFEEWISAAEPALEADPALQWKAGTFLEVIREQREAAVSVELDNSIVAKAIRRFMEKRTDWQGYVSDLHQELSSNDDFRDIFANKVWPPTSNTFSGLLDKVTPALRIVGIQVDKPKRKTQGQPVFITKIDVGDGAGDNVADVDLQKRSTLPEPANSLGYVDDVGNVDLFSSYLLKEKEGEDNKRVGERSTLPTSSTQAGIQQGLHDVDLSERSTLPTSGSASNAEFYRTFDGLKVFFEKPERCEMCGNSLFSRYNGDDWTCNPCRNVPSNGYKSVKASA